jgi:hypothetical protein
MAKICQSWQFIARNGFFWENFQAILTMTFILKTKILILSLKFKDDLKIDF